MNNKEITKIANSPPMTSYIDPICFGLPLLPTISNKTLLQCKTDEYYKIILKFLSFSTP